MKCFGVGLPVELDDESLSLGFNVLDLLQQELAELRAKAREEPHARDNLVPTLHHLLLGASDATKVAHTGGSWKANIFCSLSKKEISHTNRDEVMNFKFQKLSFTEAHSQLTYRQI